MTINSAKAVGAVAEAAHGSGDGLMAADDKDNSGGSWNSRYFKNPFCVTTW
jgi:hypothetical protein